MDIVLSPGINHIRCSSGEGGREGRTEGRKEERKKDCKGERAYCWADFAGIFTVEAGF